jgi:hypothetical protein
MSSPHDLLATLIHEHGKDAVREALAFLPRIIAMIKAGRAHRIAAFLAEAHAEIDRMADEAVRKVPRIPDAGEAE